jgi:uncharacterized protein YjbI with pentapeptide repeats
MEQCWLIDALCYTGGTDQVERICAVSEKTPSRPSPDGYASWPAYWQAQGQPWRTEPEINDERQRYLAERRVITPDDRRGVFPFRNEGGESEKNAGIKLTRADVEWLLATHEDGRGPVFWEQEKDKPVGERRKGLDLRGANLYRVNLRGLPLARIQGGHDEGNWLTVASSHALRISGIILQGAQLEETSLQGAVLGSADMMRVKLNGADMESAFLLGADLRTAVLAGANLRGACLDSSHLEDAVLHEAHLEGADLRRCALDDGTILSDVTLGHPTEGYARLADVRWNGANLAAVKWQPTARAGKRTPWQSVALGDEQQARQSKDENEKTKDAQAPLRDYEAAVRANRQLVAALRTQGLNEYADHFAYRAQVLQRAVLRRQRQWLRWLGSLLLDVVAGYGYRPLRSLLSYLLVVASFALVYMTLGGAHGQPLTWNESLVVSLTAFHGRGFFATAFQPGDPQAAMAALEAVFGLLIEITFIATFTQRFFAR